MNYENFVTTLAHIERHPERFNQNCPFEDVSACCLFAHARRLFGDMDRSRTTRVAGANVFGLDPWGKEANWLFSSFRTLDDFRRVRHVEGIRRAMSQAA